MFVYSVTRHLVVIVINLCQRGLNLSKKLIVTSQADFYSRRHFQLELLLYSSESVNHFPPRTHLLHTLTNTPMSCCKRLTYKSERQQHEFLASRHEEWNWNRLGMLLYSLGNYLLARSEKALTLLAKTLTQRAKTRYFFFVLVFYVMKQIKVCSLCLSLKYDWMNRLKRKMSIVLQASTAHTPLRGAQALKLPRRAIHTHTPGLAFIFTKD